MERLPALAWHYECHVSHPDSRATGALAVIFESLGAGRLVVGQARPAARRSET